MLPTKGPELTRIRISSGALPLVSACTAPLPSRPIAQLSPRLYGIYEDDDVGAINLASLAFAMPQRTANDPVDAMKAVIAVEYLVDELNVDPRCIGMSPFPKQEMLEAWPDVAACQPSRPTLSHRQRSMLFCVRPGSFRRASPLKPLGHSAVRRSACRHNARCNPVEFAIHQICEHRRDGCGGAD